MSMGRSEPFMLALLLCFSGRSEAAGTGAFSLGLDPSIRSVGMGSASGSVFWGNGPNYWANPALLGYHRGISYEWSETQFALDIANDISFRSNRVTFGAYGLGIGISSKPYRLGYGESEFVDSDGNVVGTFESYEEIDSWGIGMNLLEFGEAVLGSFGRTSTLHDYGDLSFGYFRKKVFINLAPAEILPDPLGAGAGSGEATTSDLGFLIRATPLNTVKRAAPGSGLDVLGGLRTDVCFGLAWLNMDDAEVVFPGADQSDPIGRDRRASFSLHVESGFPGPWERSLIQRGLGWMGSLLTPLISVGATWEWSEVTSPGEPERFEWGTTNSWGFEVTVAHVLTLRHGGIEEPAATVDGSTTGWGLGLQWGNVAGFRYDWATVPQATGLQDVDREGLVAFVDFVALARMARRPG